MPAKQDRLIEVRSQLALGLLEYFRLVIAAPDSSDNIPAYLGERTPTALYIEPDVLKRERKEEKDWERGRAEERGRGSEKERRDVRKEERERSRETIRERIAPEAQDVGESALYGEREHEIDRRVAWAKELKEIERAPSRHAVIMAPPGQGKSLLTWMTTRRLAEQASKDLYERRVEINAIPLPIVLSLNTLTEKVISPGTRPDEALRRAITATLRENLAGYPEIAVNYLAEHFHESRCWLFLDALDEASDENALALIYNVLEKRQCHVVITSRPYGYEGRQLPFNMTEYRLAPLTNAQARAFVEKWFGGGGRQARMIELLTRSYSIQRMSQSPFLLTLLCWVAERHDLADDITRTQLYDRIVLDLLGLPPNGKGEVDDRRANELLPLITEVAFASFQENAGRNPMPSKHLLAVMATSPRRPVPLGLKADNIIKLNPSERAGYLLDELTRKRLLAPLTRNRDAYVFPHRSILEYLAACSLAELVNDPKGRQWETEIEAAGKKWQVRAFVDKKAWRSDHQEAICFLAGRLNDPAPLLEILSNPKPTRTNPNGDDWLRHRLALAALCFPEVRSSNNPRASILVDRVTTEVFSTWWEHQRTGEDVSHLSRALPALGLVQGKLQPGRIGATLKWALQRIPKKLRLELRLIDLVYYMLHDFKQRIYTAHTGAGSSVVGRAVVQAVGCIGAAAATPLILDCLADLLPDTVVQTEVLEAIGGIGAAAATPLFLDRLAELLRDDYAYSMAGSAIGRIGAATASPLIFNRLVELLRDDNWRVREGAAKGIDCIGAIAATPQFLARLTELLCDDDWKVRAAAAKAIGGVGAAAATPLILDRLAELLCDHAGEVRAAAAEAVGGDIVITASGGSRGAVGLGTAAATSLILDRLAELLRDPEWYLQLRAAEAIGGIGAAAATPQFLERLAELLCDDDWKVRAAAAKAIGGVGAAAATPLILDRLAELLCDDVVEVRTAAAEAVGGSGRILIGLGGRKAGPVGIGAAAATLLILDRLAELLRDNDWYVVVKAAEAVGGIGAAAATPLILDRLAELLRDNDNQWDKSIQWEVGQVVAAEAVGGTGAAAATPQFIDRLATLLRDNDWNVRYLAVMAVGGIGAAAATPPILDSLAEVLRKYDWHGQKVTVNAISRIGAAAATPQFLDRLAELLRDNDWYVRVRAAEAVGGIGSAATTPLILDRLIELLRDNLWNVQEAAAEAVGRIGAAAATPPILDRLAELLRDDDESVRQVAVMAVESIGAVAATSPILDNLAELLRGSYVRIWAVKAMEYLTRDDVRIFRTKGIRSFILKNKFEARSMKELSA